MRIKEDGSLDSILFKVLEAIKILVSVTILEYAPAASMNTMSW
jgi:hypothetical protein